MTNGECAFISSQSRLSVLVSIIVAINMTDGQEERSMKTTTLS